MENEKKNNSGMLVGILIGIIIMLLVFVGLFATGTISFKSTTTSDNGQTSESNETNESSNKLTESEAITIIKDLYNEDIRYIFNEKVSYCGDKSDDSISSNGFTYYKSSKFHTFNELKEHLENYMTESLLNSTSYNYSTVIDGNTITSYIEKDGNLYCNAWNKGGNVERTNYSADESTFKISNIDENSIDADIIAVYNWDGTRKNNLQIKVTAVKQNNKWLLNTYKEEQ